MTSRTTASSSSAPVPAAVRQHQRALQLGEARIVDARARQETESGVDAVDGAMCRYDVGHSGCGGVDGCTGGGIHRERHRYRPQRAQRGERQGAGTKQKRRLRSGQTHSAAIGQTSDRMVSQALRRRAARPRSKNSIREHAPQRDLAVPGARRQIDDLEAVEVARTLGVRKSSGAVVHRVLTGDDTFCR